MLDRIKITTILEIDRVVDPFEGHTYTATIDGAVVGIARKGASPSSTHIADLWVDPNHRRRGIATTLYNKIEHDLGITLTPNPYSLSADGRAFWAARLNANEIFKTTG